MKTLENQLVSADKADEVKSKPEQAFVSKYEAFLGMLNKILSSENIEQKSRLMFENVKGMVQAQVYQVAIKRGVVFQQLDSDSSPQRFINPLDYLKLKGLITQAQCDATSREGLACLQALCNELIVRVVSIEGKGRDEMIEMVRAMNLMIQEHEHQDSLAKDIMLGRGPGR
jgi:hypothetical protein